MKRIKNKFTILRSGFLTVLLLLLGVAAFATNVNVTLHLMDHAATSVGDGSGTAGWNHGSWATLGATDASGNASISLAPGSSYYFNMKYHGYTQQIGPLTVPAHDTTINFQTTLVTLNLKDHTGALITAEDGIGGYNATSTWYSLGSTSGTGMNSIELLPGTGYYFNMKYHNYTQQQGSMSVTTGGSFTQNVDFQTTLVTLNLKDHTGALITSEDGIGGYNATSAWYSLGSTSGTGMNSIELLPGTGYYFNMKYHNYTQQQGIMSVTTGGSFTQNVDFQTTLVTLNLKDHTGALITAEDGIGGYNATSTWYSLGSTSGSGMNSIELLPGTGYFFNMKYHNYTQQQGSMSVTTGGSFTQNVDFQTTLVSLKLKDHTGALITAEDGIGGYNATSAWYSLGSTSGTGMNSIELLPGTGYFFNMKYHNYTQQQGSMSVTTGGSFTQNVDFQTTLVSVNLKNCSGALINTSAASAQYNTGAWYALGPISGGTTSIELLPGTGYFFNMTYNHGIQQIGSMSVTGAPWTQNVDFNTTLVSFSNPDNSPIQYNQGAWYTFTPNSMELLPGSYYFKVTGTGATVSKSISGCSRTFYIAPSGALNVSSLDNGGCSGSFTLTAPAGAGTYSWSDGDATQSTIVNAAGTYSVDVSYDFTSTGAAGGTTTYTTTVSSVSARTVTIKLMDSKGNGIAGGTVQYYSGSWQTFGSGTTDANGYACMSFPTPTFATGFSAIFRVMYAGGTKQWGSTAVAGNPVFVAQTTDVSFNLKDHTGALITAESGTANYYPGTWTPIGSTGSDGFVKKELLPGSYIVNMNFHSFTEQQSITVGAGPNQDDDFQTTLVTTSLKDHNNNGLSGGTAKYYSGAWNNIPGTTDATGTNVNIELLPGSYIFNMNYNYLTQQLPSTTIGTGPTQTVPFQTTLVSVNLKNCAGTLTNTAAATAQYYSGGWHNLGNTTAGTIPIELLPGSYIFSMAYNHGSEQLPSSTISTGPTQDVDFNTTKVTFSNPNNVPISYYQSGWNTFTPDSMELLPGNYIFKVTSSGPNASKTISGCAMNYYIAPAGTLGITTLNNGGCGGSFTLTAPVGSSSYSWSTGETTQGIGVTTSGTYSVTVNYDFTSTGTPGGTSVYTSTVSATSRTVTIRLIDSKGNPIAGGTVQYYNGSWQTFGSGTTDVNGYACMSFPTPAFTTAFSTYFKVSYCGGSKQWSGIAVANNPVLVAQTTNVVLNLKDHNGNLITTESGTGGYYAGSWTTLGSTGTNGYVMKELLPGSYYFNMNYHNYTQQVGTLTIGAGPTQNVDFQATLVTLSLKDHNGNAITAEDGTGGYYAGSWHTLGSTSGTGAVSIELLPGSGYYFNMNYHNYTQQQGSMSVIAGPTQTVNFQTTLVTLSLNDHTGTPITAEDGTGGYYAGSWHTLGSTSGTGAVAIELLPGTGYYFNMNYHNYTQQQGSMSVIAGPTQTVNFQTTLVTLNLKDHTGTPITAEDGTGGYYAGSWHTLGSTNGTGAVAIELLPGTGYYFNMNYHNYTQQQGSMSVIAGPTQAVNFQTTLVTLNLKDHTGTPITAEDGTGGYYAGSWHTMGSTNGTGSVSSEFLPGTGYYFNMNFHNGTQQIGSTSVSAGPLQAVNFTTALVNIHFQGNTGNAHSGATIKYYSGTWYTLGITDASGNASMEMLPVAYYYNATLTGYGTTQVGPFTDAAAGTPTHVIQSSSAARDAESVTPNAVVATTFGIYPNPAANKITIQFTSIAGGQTTVQLSDISGKIIINETFGSTAGTNVHDVDLSNLANGMYMLVFNNGSDNEVRKIVVQH